MVPDEPPPEAKIPCSLEPGEPVKVFPWTTALDGARAESMSRPTTLLSNVLFRTWTVCEEPPMKIPCAVFWLNVLREMTASPV